MSELSRRQSLLNIALAFNGFVGVAARYSIVRYVLSPMRKDNDTGFQLAHSISFPPARRALRHFGTPVAKSFRRRLQGKLHAGPQRRWEQVPGLRDQLPRTLGCPVPVVSAVAFI